MAIFGTNVIAFIIVLGFLIFAHEAGHFLVAKAFGVRVLTFSFGFGKRLFGFRKGDTDYRVSLIPLGGYVRMAGDTPEDNRPNDPAEFLSKPKWQRFLILFAGPAMNLIIAIGFVALISMLGTEVAVVRTVIAEVMPGKPAAQAGLQSGDRIVAVDGEPVNDFEDLKMAISMHANTPLRVDFVRNGVQKTTTLTPAREESEYGPVGRAYFTPFIDPVIGKVDANSPAARAGLKAGDRFVGINGKPASQFTDLDRAVIAAKGAPIAIDVQRGGQVVHAVLPGVGKLNVEDPYRGLWPLSETHKLSFFPAIADSVQQNWKMLKYTGTAISRIFHSQGSVKELSGPISIARISGDMLRRGWIAVIGLMAMISLQLGIMNLLPIPILDGGHIAVLLVEGAARRELSLATKERIQQIGFALLATLMIVVLYNDVVQNFFVRRG